MWHYINVNVFLSERPYLSFQISNILPVFYAAEYTANSGVHHLTEEECNGCGVGV